MSPVPTSPMLRSATEADLPSIHDIYNFYVHTSTCTFQLKPEPFDDRIAWFRHHGERHPVIVAESNGEVIGWGSLSPWKERAGYAGSVEASVYVHHDWHRRGVGKALLAELIERARNLGHHVLIGGACTEHPGSIALQESLGFGHVAYFRETGRKFDRWLDVVYLQLILNPDTASQ